jgi:hypothetical protein
LVSAVRALHARITAGTRPEVASPARPWHGRPPRAARPRAGGRGWISVLRCERWNAAAYPLRARVRPGAEAGPRTEQGRARLREAFWRAAPRRPGAQVHRIAVPNPAGDKFLYRLTSTRDPRTALVTPLDLDGGACLLGPGRGITPPRTGPAARRRGGRPARERGRDGSVGRCDTAAEQECSLFGPLKKTRDCTRDKVDSVRLPAVRTRRRRPCAHDHHCANSRPIQVA